MPRNRRGVKDYFHEDRNYRTGAIASSAPEVEQRIESQKALMAELKRKVASCAHGGVGQCPVIENPRGPRAMQATRPHWCGSSRPNRPADRPSVDMASRCAAACAAARPRFLNRRAWDVPVRTEHAAIARFRLQHGFASRAFVEILAGVGWHCFGCFMPADRTGEHRYCSQSKRGPLNSSARTDTPRPLWRERARGSRPWRRHK
jgi:hypothetical protein